MHASHPPPHRPPIVHVSRNEAVAQRGRDWITNRELKLAAKRAEIASGAQELALCTFRPAVNPRSASTPPAIKHRHTCKDKPDPYAAAATAVSTGSVAALLSPRSGAASPSGTATPVYTRSTTPTFAGGRPGTPSSVSGSVGYGGGGGGGGGSALYDIVALASSRMSVGSAASLASLSPAAERYVARQVQGRANAHRRNNTPHCDGSKWVGGVTHAEGFSFHKRANTPTGAAARARLLSSPGVSGGGASGASGGGGGGGGGSGSGLVKSLYPPAYAGAVPLELANGGGGGSSDGGGKVGAAPSSRSGGTGTPSSPAVHRQWGPLSQSLALSPSSATATASASGRLISGSGSGSGSGRAASPSPTRDWRQGLLDSLRSGGGSSGGSGSGTNSAAAAAAVAADVKVIAAPSPRRLSSSYSFLGGDANVGSGVGLDVNAALKAKYASVPSSGYGSPTVGGRNTPMSPVTVGSRSGRGGNPALSRSQSNGAADAMSPPHVLPFS